MNVKIGREKPEDFSVVHKLIEKAREIQMKALKNTFYFDWDGFQKINKTPVAGFYNWLQAFFTL